MVGAAQRGRAAGVSARLSLEPRKPQQRFVVVDDAGAGTHCQGDAPIRRKRDRGSIDDAFAAIIRDRAEGIIVGSDPVNGQARIIEFAAANHLPAISAFRGYVASGGLMSYGPNLHELGRRVAAYVDKIFKGARPADLRVEQPTTFELVINLKTAKSLGLTIPHSLLLRADEVIE